MSPLLINNDQLSEQIKEAKKQNEETKQTSNESTWTLKKLMFAGLGIGIGFALTLFLLIKLFGKRPGVGGPGPTVYHF